LRDEQVRFITTRHEQATTYMADGYARAGGEGGFGTALVVPGPGPLNAAAGLSTAYSASSPLLMLCGQVPKRYLGRDVGVLHEACAQRVRAAPAMVCVNPVPLKGGIRCSCCREPRKMLPRGPMSPARLPALAETPISFSTSS